MASDADDTLRREIADVLAGGLETEVFPRAEDSAQVNSIVSRLQTEGTDLSAKLAIAGFTDHTITADGLEQPCETCMYYLIQRKFCDLPELMLPVEPEWSCRLWRI
jgi:hypothetical protein